MKQELNQEPYFGLPKIEGTCLMLVRGATLVRKPNREGKEYETFEIEAVFQMDDAGTSHFGLHKFDKMGERGAYLAATKGKPVLVELSKNGRGYPEISVIGLMSEFKAQADALLKAVA